MKHAYHIQAEEDDCSENMQLAIGIGCSVYNSSASGKNCWLVPLENCTEHQEKKIISESFRKGLKLRVSGFAMVEIAKNVLGKSILPLRYDRKARYQLLSETFIKDWKLAKVLNCKEIAGYYKGMISYYVQATIAEQSGSFQVSALKNKENQQLDKLVNAISTTLNSATSEERKNATHVIMNGRGSDVEKLELAERAASIFFPP